MIRTSQRLTPTLLAVGALALFGAACGDDDGGNPADAGPDSAVAFDANTTDAPPAVVPTRSGTIAVTEVKLLSNDLATNRLAIGGAAITVSFEDLTMGGGTVDVVPTTPGCTVVSYQCPAGNCPFHPPVDVGPVQLSNTDSANPAILGPVPPQCTYNDDTDTYRCPVLSKTALEGTVSRAAASKVNPVPPLVFTFPSETFTNFRGTWVVLTGFAGPLAGLNGQPLPVVAVPATNTIAVGVPGAAIPATAITGIGLTALQGFRPVPGGANPAGPIDFLSDHNPASETLRIQMAASATNGYPMGLDLTFGPAGSGFTLTPTCVGTTQQPGACISPLQFPTTIATNAPPTGVDYKFSCAAPGVCGPAGSGSIPGALVFSGTASNGDIDGLQPFEMPTTGITRFASFSCSNFGENVGLPNNVIKAILDINPTRIETRVLRVAAATHTDATSKNTARIVVGHGFVGHTDVPQAK